MSWKVSRFRAGDLVEVRSREEILATLDREGCVDGMPFMPEMLQFCGRKIQVAAVAHKTCDVAMKTRKARRLDATVHLEGSACDGSAHGGCQAACLIFWKEVWLKRAARDSLPSNRPASAPGITRSELEQTTRRSSLGPASADVYVCQATELPRATSPLRWWDPRQYLRELRSGNVRLGVMLRVLALSWYNVVARRLAPLGLRRYPQVSGRLLKTPTASLGLQAGERVRIKDKAAIVETLDRRNKNRGLVFDVEMVPYCGREFVVRERVQRLIDERTGKMIDLPRDCIMLEGVICSGHLSRERLFCPRSIPPYWREIWLERVEAPRPAAPPGPAGRAVALPVIPASPETKERERDV